MGKMVLVVLLFGLLQGLFGQQNAELLNGVSITPLK